MPPAKRASESFPTQNKDQGKKQEMTADRAGRPPIPVEAEKEPQNYQYPEKQFHAHNITQIITPRGLRQLVVYFRCVQPPADAAPQAPPSTDSYVHTAWGTYVPKKSTAFKYGYYWNKDDHPLTVELRAYRMGIPIHLAGLGKAGHFKECVNTLWGENNPQKQFLWNPWSDRMLEASLEHKYLSVAGCANAGKSDFYAVYALVNWLADPIHTMVLITSTSLKESRGRIWGAVEEYFNSAQKMMGGALPAKLVSSVGIIKMEDPTGEYKTSDRSGIHLIAGEKKKEKESIGKLIGLKNQRVFLIADELPELSPALIAAAVSNLDANPEFQMIGIGNPNSIYDPHGIFSRPKMGWKSVTPADDEWETELGYCIRFDAYKSPNVLAGRVIYKWLPTQAKIDSKKEDLGEDSLEFWRMWRGFWCPTGGTESVVAEADIVRFDCEQKVKRWKNNQFVWLSFLDPGYTNGGDRSVLYFAKFGVNEDTGLETLEFYGFKVLHENIMLKDVSRNYQIVHQFRDECVKRNIPPQHCGVDDTGAAAFGDIVHTEWSKQVIRVQFGGNATERTVSAHDKTRACDKYQNRVTEIWCSVREYMRSNQIRGLEPDLGVELTARKMVHKKSGPGLKQCVESKEIMRSRTGKSPDIADAALGILDIARCKFKFRAAARTAMAGATAKNFKAFQKKLGQMQHGSNLHRDYASDREQVPPGAKDSLKIALWALQRPVLHRGNE
jgi:hypothetical protein